MPMPRDHSRSVRALLAAAPACSAVWTRRSERVACKEARVASSFASAALSTAAARTVWAVCGSPARKALRPDCEAVNADIRLAS